MSLITEARTKADAAVRTRADAAAGTAKATLSLAQNVFSAATDDVAGRVTTGAEGVRAVATSVSTVASGVVSTVATVARKQALATLGAGDLVVEALTKRAEELPVEVQRNAGKGVATASSLARTARGQATATASQVRARGEQVRARGEKVVVTARHAELPEVPPLRSVIDARVGQAMDTLDKLAERGEHVVRSVTRSPRVLDTVRDLDHAAEGAANEVSSVAGKVRYRAAANARSVRSAKGAATRAAAASHVTAAAPAPAKRAATKAATKSAPAKRTASKTAAVATKRTPTKRTATKPAAPAKRAATATKRTATKPVAPAKRAAAATRRTATATKRTATATKSAARTA